MTLPQTILVATDFSETSDRALDYAIQLASRIGASIVVMHAYELPVLDFAETAYIPRGEVVTSLASAAKAGLDAVVEARATCGVHLQAIAKQDKPWKAVNTVAAAIGADMVVCGTHGRKGLAYALLGSVAEKIIRTSTVPVLTIGGPCEMPASPAPSVPVA